MPDSISTCGELIMPPASSTSRWARADLRFAALAIFDADRATAFEHARASPAR